MKYFISEGCSVVSKRGILGEHSEVSPGDFGHKDDTNLKALEAKGKVYSAKKSKSDAEKAKKKPLSNKKSKSDAEKDTE